MPRLATTLALTAVTAVSLGAGLTSLGPHQTSEQQRRQQVERQRDELSDADARSKETMRERGDDLQDGENRRRLVPGEYRPGRPPRVRLIP